MEGPAVVLAETRRVAAEVVLDGGAHVRLVLTLGPRRRPQGRGEHEGRQSCEDYLFHQPLPH